ncbi:MAG: ribonuclease P protein component [bacterium]|nr:ribonuclease P protein component [bacterium]
MKKQIFDILKNGRRFETENFIFYIKGVDDNFLKVCFQINRSYASSVVRNRIKRIFRDLIRETLGKGNLVIRAKNCCKNLTLKDINEEWEKILKQIS